MGELQQVTNLFDMTTDCKVTELFCIIDEFCKHFDAENAGNLQEDNSGVKRRRRAASLSDSETINDMLKNTAQIVHSRHRSVSNFIMNLISALGAYCFFDNKPKALQGYRIEDTKTAVTILRAKQLLSAFCYYPLLMAWEGGVCTLHLYWIRHSVIPN